MQLKKTVAAVVLGLGFAGFAQANFVKDLGELSFANSPLTFEGSPGSASGDFADWFTFNVASNVLASSATAVVIEFHGSPNFLEAGLTVAVYKGAYTNNNLNGLYALPLLASFTADSDFTVSGNFNFDPTWTEGYTFLIQGKTTGGSGIYSFGVTAVPEPAEYAMLLAGLGVVGMVARRRKMNVN